ncbi:hypothetical protein [uncultured Paraglaciecola sp.]|uniref:hypothetical protein n=1 Tax=uncultured Paraglaciecola sp. TaxID=1765024 RepID=UPI00261B9918|nr:hypothetical protein [uncultured Paraglaciecola sp.]
MQTLASEFSQVYKEFVTSTDALQKWRYAPKFADGQAVATKKMKVQMDFKVRKSAQR